ncbi:MAG: 50S ribosomal protein L32 [Clostridia bacterium]|jgi:large subunit ribosomal protein L32|nr:50S ribosomal protein L32 [Clostridia bacterium]MDH7573897.1 50S ribosomal protein L32 [Clostridia bacterium]
MGVPKRRVSKARKRHRRSIWAQVNGPTLSPCPQCHEPKLPHRVCPNCGYYRGRKVAGEEK